MSHERRERQRERQREEMERLIANVDLLWSSPTERAEEVWVLIQEGCAAIKAPMPTGWDLMCFNAEALGKAAIGLGNPEFLGHVREVLKFIYNAHYNQPREVLGPPDKVAAAPQGEGNGKGNDALQSEQKHDHQEREVSSGHARGSEDAPVALGETEETRVQDS